MPIIYQKFITRGNLRDNPEQFYVFGDNAVRHGMGGQAGHMRGEPNAIGVATKRSPSMQPDAFFSDKEPNFPGQITKDMNTVAADLAKIVIQLELGETVVAPIDGLGTGLSELPQRAPKLYASLWHWFDERSDENGCPWLPRPE